MEHKQDRFVGSYWVGKRKVNVSIVWKSWSYDIGNEYCKREDYVQEGKRWTYIFYDNSVLEKDYSKLYRDICIECARHNMD